MKRLFGTDGIRGTAGREPLSAETVRRVGAALGQVLREGGCAEPRVVLGRDTRESGTWIRDALSEGIADRSGKAVDAGVVTTPGLAFSITTGSFDAGVMISASHNPFEDNGLKVFGRDAMKLSDALEAEIERYVLDTGVAPPTATGERAAEDGALALRYVEYLEHAVALRDRFRGLRVVLDCANGSAYRIAPEVFRHYGADVAAIGIAPDGRNINLRCGSTHLDGVTRAVVDGRFDLGVAFDGDADRALLVDRHGRSVDGDLILYLVSRKLRREGVLRGDVVVATVMSNFWLEKRLADEGVRLVRTPVGDKYVLERMIEDDAALGGEQSGHVIFRDRSTTGDGILTALLALDAILDEAEPLETLLDGIEPCPQVLLNVPVREKPDLRAHAAIGPVVEEVERTLSESGRVVLRYSGTEPLARVMVEGFDAEAVRHGASRIADAIRDVIGDRLLNSGD